MADFSISISNSFNLLGESPTSNWGFFTWGTDKWGEGSKDLSVAVVKLISNSLVPDSSQFFDVTRLSSNSLEPSFETGGESLMDGSGYYYIFTLPTIDPESRSTATWTSGR